MKEFVFRDGRHETWRQRGKNSQAAAIALRKVLEMMGYSILRIKLRRAKAHYISL